MLCTFDEHPVCPGVWPGSAIGRIAPSGPSRWSRPAACELGDEDAIIDRSRGYQRLMHAVIEAPRAATVPLLDDRVIAGDVMRRVERDLDLEGPRRGS